MGRIVGLVALLVIALPPISFAERKDAAPPTSLAEDAASLGEKGGQPKGTDPPDPRRGWVSEKKVTVTFGAGMKLEPKLQMWLFPEKEKPTGALSLGLDHGDSRNWTSQAHAYAFELVEKGGKRYIKITARGEAIATLEYLRKADKLILRGAVTEWAGPVKADFTKGITFKRAGK